MSIVDYKSPEELVAFLRTNPPKAKGQFAEASGPGRCCLGHYADMCGIEYVHDQGEFHDIDDDGAVLPAGHWLRMGIEVRGDRWGLQSKLAELNDAYDGYDEVIEAIEQYAIGGQS